MHLKINCLSMTQITNHWTKKYFKLQFKKKKYWCGYADANGHWMGNCL